MCDDSNSLDRMYFTLKNNECFRFLNIKDPIVKKNIKNEIKEVFSNKRQFTKNMHKTN